MRYGYVENGMVVKGPTGLPRSWANVSGFDLLSDEELKNYGWLPWQLVEIELDSDEVYEPSTVQITNSAVIETQVKRKKTQEEIAAENSQKADEVRSERNARLSASDWTQVLDAQVDRTVWANYRQALRDLPSQSGFPWNVTWPDQPA